MKKLLSLIVVVRLLTFFVLVNKPALSATITKPGTLSITVEKKNIQDGIVIETMTLDIYNNLDPTTPFATYSILEDTTIAVPVDMDVEDNAVLYLDWWGELSVIGVDETTREPKTYTSKSNVVSEVLEGDITLPPKQPICGQLIRGD